MSRYSSKLTVLLLLAQTLIILANQGACAQTKSKGKILVVVSSQKMLTLKNGKVHPTGFYLNELGVPVYALIEAGYEPVFCNPLGNAPAMDKNSDKASYFGNEAEYKAVKSLVEHLPGLQHPLTLKAVASSSDLLRYAGIFIPGGHAPMEDLWNQPMLGKILREFHNNKKPTALICHGPIALLSTMGKADILVDSLEQKKPTATSSWTYIGYHMTVFSDAEEKPNEPKALGGYMKFYPEDALSAAGAEVSVAPPKKSYVVQDHELITGQNPFSDKELAAAFLKALAAHKHRP